MLYDFRCRECGTLYENIVLPISRCDDGPECCGEQTQKVFLVAPMGFVDNMEEYRCPVTNEGVTTRKQRNEIMAREGLVDANDLLKSDEDRFAQQAAHDKKRAELEAAKPKEVQRAVNDWAREEVAQ
jgi:hypothetical protein